MGMASQHHCSEKIRHQPDNAYEQHHRRVHFSPVTQAPDGLNHDPYRNS